MASVFQAAPDDGAYWRNDPPGSCPLAVELGRSFALFTVFAQAVAPDGRSQLVLQVVAAFVPGLPLPLLTLPVPATCTYAVPPAPKTLCVPVRAELL